MESGKGFYKHESSESHKLCYDAWNKKQRIESGELKSIADKLCPNANEIAKENKEYLLILFKYVLWFTTNNIATRGHDETEESEKQGNWRQTRGFSNCMKISLDLGLGVQITPQKRRLMNL